MYFYYNLETFPQITRFYHVTRNTIWEIAENDNILIFIQDGNCTITYENVVYPLNPGDIFFVPANHVYKRSSIDGLMCTMTYIHFTFSKEGEQLDQEEFVQKIFDSKTQLDNQILDGAYLLTNQNTLYLRNKFTLKNHDKIFLQLNDIRLLSARRQLMCGLQSSIILCSILSSLSQSTIEQVSTDSSIARAKKIPDNLKKAIRYIRSHYTEKISLDELAGHCTISKQQLIRYFKEAFHQTPVSYITEYKINRAKELLFNQPHLTLGEISDELGFDNQHYFSRVFLKVTGETPSHYRYRTVKFTEYIKQKQR